MQATTTTTTALYDQISHLPQLPSDHTFGTDIDDVNLRLLDENLSSSDKAEVLRKWISRKQPCLFGRLTAQGVDGPRGLGSETCWISTEDLQLGDDHVTNKIQESRRRWKDLATEGRASGFLIVVNDPYLAGASASAELVDVCIRLSNCYLIEHAPIQADVIYTEAVPLRRSDGQLTLFKAGCNIFYSGAHRTVNHDRRVPGGLIFSMNSPGHYAQSAAIRGVFDSFEESTHFVRETAIRSIGNGGIGCPHTPSASWHNVDEETPDGATQSEKPKRPGYVPTELDEARYSAVYHTDVLVPTDVTSNPNQVHNNTFESVNAEVWPHLILDYITTEQFTADHVNYALFHGHPIEECGKYHNPWQARVAHNSELFEY